MLFNLNNYTMNNSTMGVIQNALQSVVTSNYSSNYYGMNNSIFRNCYGQQDYDAVSGYQTLNLFAGVAGMAINQYVSQREPKVDHEQEAKDLKSEIAQKELKHAELNIEKTSLEGAIKTAQDASDNLTSDILREEDAARKLEVQYESLIANNADGSKTASAVTVKEQLDAANEKVKELKEEKAEQDEIVTKKGKELEACKKNIARVEKEIEILKDDLKEHQNEVNNDILEKANGNRLTRTPDDEYAQKLDNGKLKANVEYTKSDMRTAINQFMNEANGTDAKLAKAKIICEMFDALPEKERNKTFGPAREIAAKYIADNKS